MTPQGKQVLRDALDLPPIDRAELIEQVLASFKGPARQDIDAAWVQEQRIASTPTTRENRASPASEVFKELDR